MITYAIIVLVLAAGVLVAAALLDRRRAREIQPEMTEHPSEHPSDETPGRHRG